MKHDDTPMWDDPNESAFVRELLQSGRRTQVEYDVERGLSEHLARISAGAGAPSWAGSGASAIAKSGAPSWLGFVILPLAAAGIASLAWVLSTTQPTAPTVEQLPTEQTIHVTPAPAALPTTLSPTDRGSQTSMSASTRDRAVRARSRAREEDDATSREARPGQSARAATDGEPRAPRATDNAARVARTSDADARGRTPSLAPTSGQRTASTAPGDTRPSDAHAAAMRSHGAGASRTAAQSESHVQPPPAAERANAVEKPAASGAKPAAAPVVDESQLEREMQMLAVTQRVLASNPSRALRLAEQGEREFPRTMFSAERRQLALLAMVKLGRLDEARRIGQPFLAQYPKAPWSERLRRALATGQVD
jgi:hypothetical protein